LYSFDVYLVSIIKSPRRKTLRCTASDTEYDAVCHGYCSMCFSMQVLGGC